MSFYRKYRPSIISEIDNTYVQGELYALLGKAPQERPHAFLLTGSKGAGKTTAARIIAKMLNCEKPTKTGPCGKCDQCNSISNGSNLDVLELDAASNRGIDEIRTLREGIALTPVHGRYKVYIIDEVHMLTAEAFNALLKTLEEPPAHAVFVLATTDPQKIPATIKSRCIEIVFKRAGEEELARALSRVIEEEKLLIEADAIDLIIHQAGGSFRDAIKMLEQVSFHTGKITKEVIEKTLALSTDKHITGFIDALHAKKTKELILMTEAIVEEGRDIKSFIVAILEALKDILLDQIQGKSRSVWQAPDLKRAIDVFTRAYADIRISPVVQLPVEMAIIEFCGAGADIPVPTRSPVTTQTKHEKQEAVVKDAKPVTDNGLLTLDKIVDHWADLIEATKPFNHSIAGVLRSTRPKAVTNGIVTIEAFYPFHQEKLSELKTREALAQVLKKLFGENVMVEIVLGKK